MTYNNLGQCCNYVNIQSDSPASEVQHYFMGDYEKIGNDSNVYKSVMDSGFFLHKSPSVDGVSRWMVCTNYLCSSLQ